MMLRSPRSVLLCVMLASGLLPAQTGPWTDGELLVRSVANPQSQVSTLYRIIPETGDGEPLISGFQWVGSASSMAFDPYRDGIIASMGVPPSIFSYDLWVVSSDGTTTSIPGFTGEWFRAITPIGDGRIYFQQASNNAANEIHYLDASNVEHVLMDQSGMVPFSFYVERMLYHAPTNSFLAMTSGWYSSNTCSPSLTSVFRIPLSPDGSRVAGPVVCASLPVANVVMGMDYMPGGDVLVTLAGSQFYNDTILRLDPVSLTTTIFASPGPADLDGGVWSTRVGRAIVLDDTNNVLRSYGPGQGGGGLPILADVTVSPNTTGYSIQESMIRIDTNGPGCTGSAAQFGAGVAGTGGFVPTLGVIGCPDLGAAFSLSIAEVRGAATGVLAVGNTLASIPALGGTVYVFPYQLLLPVAVNGQAGVGGAGSFGLPLLFTDPSFIGFTVYFQGAFVDPNAVQGISLTNGLVLTIG